MKPPRAAQSAEELALLRNVVADLSDDDALGVYCDWLEDHADPRGAFLRSFLKAFAEQRPLPPDPPDLNAAWAELLALPVRRRMQEGGFTRLKPHFPDVLRSGHPAIRMELGTPVPAASIPLGISRAGDLPDLASDAQWPTAEGGWPLPFLFQINLTDLHGTIVQDLLPDRGLLAVFHEPESDSPCRSLCYTPPGIPLVRMLAPEPYDHPHSLGPSPIPVGQTYSLRLVEVLRFTNAVPGVDLDLWYEGLGGPRGYGYLLGRDEWDRGVHYFCTTWKPDSTPECGEHCVFDLVPRTFLELLRIDEHTELQWGFGDGGTLSVFVPAEEARAGVFSTVHAYET